MRTLCIDTRMWGITHTGIGRYVENLIANLPSDEQVRTVLIISPAQVGEPRLAKFEKYIARFHPYRFLSLIEMHWLLFVRIRPSVLHVPHIVVPFLWPGRIVLTVHDLIKHYSRGPSASTHRPWVYWFKYLQYLAMVRASIFRARHIIVPSQYWKNELIKRYKTPPSKISVTYEGVPDHFLTTRAIPTHFEVPQPYVIYTGNLYPHKNVPTLIQAIEILNAKRRVPLHLAVVCSRSVFEDRLPHSPFVKFLGRVSDTDLISLYRHAAAFVFPSLIEGFGLPGLEAMAVGCPVIAAWATCLPEVYGKAALFFEPTSPTDLADKIHLLLTDNRLRHQLVSAGKKQVKRYSWVKLAKQTWQIYLKALP